MSSKEITTTFKSISTEYFCDLCGKKSNWKCQICKIDICKSHTVYDPDDFETDYPYTYCKQCWDIGSKHRQKIKDLENKIEKLTGQWHEKAIELRNKSISP